MESQSQSPPRWPPINRASENSLDSLFRDTAASPLPSIHSLLASTPSFTSPPLNVSNQPPSHSTINSRSEPEFIDLTEDSPPLAPIMPARRRYRDSAEPARKRRRLAEPQRISVEASEPVRLESVDVVTATIPTPTNSSDGIEEVDLTHVKNDLDLKKHQAEQRRRHAEMEEQQSQLLKECVTAQSQGSGLTKLSNMSCIICMETITNMTATHCGHIFCHECIMQALIAGERSGHEPGKGLSRCPVCRKKVTRVQAKAPQQVIPLEFKFIRCSAKSKGKQRETQPEHRSMETQEALWN